MSETVSHLQVDVRNRALLAADRDHADAVRDADIEYSETVTKLRDAFEVGLIEAQIRRHSRVLPADRAYNAAVIAAEQKYRTAVRAELAVS